MTAPASPSKLAVIFAGEQITATLLDGRTLTVRVRAMPVRHLGRVLDLCTDEAALLDFVCLVPGEPAEGAEIAGWARVPDGWADNLSEASHDALITAAKKLNFSRAESWGRRQLEAGKMRVALMTATNEMLQPAVDKMLRLLSSSLPQFAPPAAPATKS